MVHRYLRVLNQCIKCNKEHLLPPLTCRYPPTPSTHTHTHLVTSAEQPDLCLPFLSQHIQYRSHCGPVFKFQISCPNMEILKNGLYLETAARILKITSISTPLG